MNSKLIFRSWFYFRQGWSTYFAFIMAAINTLTVTYYLAIQKYPILIEIFPSFIHYVTYAILIGVPVLTFAGYAHYKKMAAYKAEADIGFESNPYFRRILVNSEVLIPLHLKILELMIKISKNEKLTSSEIEELSILQKELQDHGNLKNGSKSGKLFEKDFNKLKTMDT